MLQNRNHKSLQNEVFSNVFMYIKYKNTLFQRCEILCTGWRDNLHANKLQTLFKVYTRVKNLKKINVAGF